MNLKPTDIDGVLIGRDIRYNDRRGWLTELYRSDKLPENFAPAMSYVSMTVPGAVRGPHEHKDQSDCLIFPGMGHFRIFLWDNRPNSRTFEKQLILESSESDTLILIIPPGVVHGYKNIGSGEAIAVNAPDRLYRGQGGKDEVDEIRHENMPDSPFKIV